MQNTPTTIACSLLLALFGWSQSGPAGIIVDAIELPAGDAQIWQMHRASQSRYTNGWHALDVAIVPSPAENLARLRGPFALAARSIAALIPWFGEKEDNNALRFIDRMLLTVYLRPTPAVWPTIEARFRPANLTHQMLLPPARTRIPQVPANWEDLPEPTESTDSPNTR